MLVPLRERRAAPQVLCSQREPEGKGRLLPSARVVAPLHTSEGVRTQTPRTRRSAQGTTNGRCLPPLAGPLPGSWREAGSWRLSWAPRHVPPICLAPCLPGPRTLTWTRTGPRHKCHVYGKHTEKKAWSQAFLHWGLWQARQACRTDPCLNPGGLNRNPTCGRLCLLEGVPGTLRKHVPAGTQVYCVGAPWHPEIV